jgi:hypothetical protein
VTATNGNLVLLAYIRNLLANYFAVQTTGPYKRGPAPGNVVCIKGKWAKVNLQNYIIRVSRFSLTNFEEYVGFTIGRKKESLKKLVESRR